MSDNKDNDDFEEVTTGFRGDTPWTVLGMDLVSSRPDDVIMHPIGAVVIVKEMDKDGSFGYRVLNTDGINAIDALGLIRYADVQLQDIIRAGTSHGDECQEDDDS